MFAISFDMKIGDLKKHYGDPYNKAYSDIRKILQKYDFFWVQGSTYLTENEDLSNLYDAISELSDLQWFCESVQDIRGYKVENWSNFTASVKRKLKK